MGVYSEDDNHPYDIAIVRGSDEMEANAALISAAPELLAALEYAVEITEANESKRPDGYGTPQNVLSWLAEANAAIRKAKGE